MQKLRRISEQKIEKMKRRAEKNLLQASKMKIDI